MNETNQSLHNEFQKSADWKQKLARKGAFKALDIADEDVNIHVRKTGMGWKELLVVGLLLIGGILGSSALRPTQDAPAISPTPPADPVELEIEFKHEDGEWITIPRRVK